MSNNQYNPDYPKTLDNAIKMLQDAHDETNVMPIQTDFSEGYLFAMKFSIIIMDHLKRNTEDDKDKEDMPKS